MLAGHGTLIEVQEHWSLDDLVDCHEALDIRAEIEKEEAEKAKHGNR